MRTVLGRLASQARMTLGDEFLDGLYRALLAQYAPDDVLLETLTRWAETDETPLVPLIDEIDMLIFLNFLISKLPAPEEEDLPKGILDPIDMDRLPRQEAGAAGGHACPTPTPRSSPCRPAAAATWRNPSLDRFPNIL